jgi:hypothetical protein
MKKITVFIMLMLIAMQTSLVCAGDWPIYSKPEFRGRVIDAETKEPIEDAVAAIGYSKYVFFPALGGGRDSLFKSEETLTDKNGEFYFPAYLGFTPFSKDDIVKFVFYKRGYMYSYGPSGLNALLMEKYFSSDVIGKVAEIRAGEFYRWTGPLGIVELRRPKTEEDRKWAKPSLSGIADERNLKNELPLLYKEIYGDN